MKCEFGVWFPDNEFHLVKMLRDSPRVDGKGTYQIAKLNAAMKYVRKWDQAVDVGMHVGLWSMHLCKRFKNVTGFEPVPEHIKCLHRNMDGISNFHVYNCALGDKVNSVGFKFLEGSTGSTQIAHVDNGIPMFPLDEFPFDHVDFIKIDVEGYEYYVVKGGEKTIKKHKPVMIIEQKPKGKAESYGLHRFSALHLLQSWGGKVQFEMSGDFCVAW
jgi:FkbM family methyltransferase